LCFLDIINKISHTETLIEMKRMRALIIPFILVCLIAVSAIIIVYVLKNNSNTAIINLQELYNGFDLKKSLEGKLAGSNGMRKNYLDSLKRDIIFHQQLLEGRNNDLQLEKLVDYKINLFRLKQKELDEQTQSQIEEFDKQIWLQLNSYVKEYGNKNGYDCIFGTNGEGNVMYVAPNKDITKDAIEYVNNKFNGISK